MPSIFDIETLIGAYTQGYFPMAEDDGLIYWHNPDPRAIIPFKNRVLPKSLKKYIQKHNIHFTVDQDFEKVIRMCGNTRKETWINEELIKLYSKLHRLNLAHSIETRINGELVGGLYGVSIGAAFFGESMFSTISNGSKAAFYLLLDILSSSGFLLLDAQYINSHTEMLGAIEIPKSHYLEILTQAINLAVDFRCKSDFYSPICSFGNHTDINQNSSHNEAIEHERINQEKYDVLFDGSTFEREESYPSSY